ncbi:hypothetical protein B0H13DRAFT_2291920 [Mycena leptocephala]|nr:hypothetical protein B0H13DRAFT_2291920 [Mycena leptocephala]
MDYLRRGRNVYHRASPVPHSARRRGTRTSLCVYGALLALATSSLVSTLSSCAVLPLSLRWDGALLALASSCDQSAPSLRVRPHVQANCDVDGPRSCLVFCPVHQAATGVLARQLLASGDFSRAARGVGLAPPRATLCFPSLPFVSVTHQSSDDPPSDFGHSCCCSLLSLNLGAARGDSAEHGVLSSATPVSAVRSRIHGSCDQAAGAVTEALPFTGQLRWAGTMMIVVHYTSSAKWIASSGSSGGEADDVWDPPKARESCNACDRIVPAMDPGDEAAASPLWAVYVSEAEKYDKSLVESWKSDMEGMLIFAGLFSASLTAFIIESYKMLIPDSGESTVRLLSQISQQLTATANGSTFQAPLPAHFSPSVSSLICNALWFISLGLSLTCALIATLLEQWARDFLHRADMRSSPVIRARIYSYLYYGLKRFNMHTVVDIIPLLLHASLLFFFGGLVAFLLPISLAIAVVAAALLAVLVTIYSTLTLLPLWHLDCPYHTPLSTAVWRISQSLMAVWYHPREAPEVYAVPNPFNSLSTETMVEAMSHRAMEISPARSARDYRALVWTVRSLADDVELEPFVEALPDLLWAPGGRRYTYEDHIQKLMRQSDLHLLSRIEMLLQSCDSGLLTPEASRRRQVTCYKALWAIASVQPPPESSNLKSLDFTPLLPYLTHNAHEPEVSHYYTSAKALLQWSTFCTVKSRLDTLVDDLVKYNVEVQGTHTPPDLTPIISYLESPSILFFSFPQNELFRLRQHVSETTDSALIIPQLIHVIKTFGSWIVFGETCLGTEDWSWNDTLMQSLCRFWKPTEDEPVVIPPVIYFLNNRNSENVLARLLFATGITGHLWSSFPITLVSWTIFGNPTFTSRGTKEGTVVFGLDYWAH